ncbi:MAG: hypothetical protein ABR574_00735 [Cryomorphaceae bacterium]
MKDGYIELRYSFRSALMCGAEFRCIEEHSTGIYLRDPITDRIDLIGDMRFTIININHAVESGVFDYWVFDNISGVLADNLAEIVDFETEMLNERILAHYSPCMLLLNIVFIDEIYLKPEYRGHFIGAKVIKDAIVHFSGGASLFVIQPIPMQFYNSDCGLAERDELIRLGSDIDESTKRLTKYFECMGFESIEGIPELLFYSPHFVNERLETIDLDEDVLDMEWWKNMGD